MFPHHRQSPYYLTTHLDHTEDLRPPRIWASMVLLAFSVQVIPIFAPPPHLRHPVRCRPIVLTGLRLRPHNPSDRCTILTYHRRHCLRLWHITISFPKPWLSRHPPTSTPPPLILHPRTEIPLVRLRPPRALVAHRSHHSINLRLSWSPGRAVRPP